MGAVTTLPPPPPPLQLGVGYTGLGKGIRVGHQSHLPHPLWPVLLYSSQIQFCLAYYNKHQLIWAYCVPGPGEGVGT